MSKSVITYSLMFLIIVSVIYWIIVLLYEICTGWKTKKTRTKLHWSKIKAKKKEKVQVREKQKVKIILMPGVNKVPKNNIFKQLPTKSLQVKKKHTPIGASPEPVLIDGKDLFEGMDFDMGDLLDEHDDDHNVDEEQKNHQGLLANVEDGFHKNQRKGNKFHFLNRSETRLLDDLFDQLDDDEDDEIDGSMMSSILNGGIDSSSNEMQKNLNAGDMMAALILNEDKIEHNRKPIKSRINIKKLKNVKGWGKKKKNKT